MKQKTFYVTTAIPYVNAAPHVGHALEFVQGDVIARYHKMLGESVLFLSGGDENALKNVQAAEDVGKDVQVFVDENSVLFEQLAKKLDVDFDVFQKGSSDVHYKSSQKLWKKCYENGDIYKKEYTGLYCVGCETFYEKSELNEQGECFEHPGKKLDEVSETNYFFRLSKYQDQITSLITNNELMIVPESRKNEILSFISQGLEDISISRSNKRAKDWGVPVPEDPNQRMYVWFDALNIYQSGVGFGWNEEKYNNTWPADVHVIGKGIIRFHAVYWPAFLLSAGLKLPKTLFVHGYFTVDGAKMSKTVGNVVDPVSLIDTYDVDVLRYYFLREIPSTSDGDFSERRLREIYSADLANGLGNAVSRVAKLCEKSNFSFPLSSDYGLSTSVAEHLNAFSFDKALAYIWDVEIRKSVDEFFSEKKPWTLEGEELHAVLAQSVESLRQIAVDLSPFMPQTSEKIKKQFFSESISSDAALFPRLE